ncbi:AraC family transcriptional regulator [Pseudomonas sp. TH03]|uniref:AraC family transcriptional regulator n=1 Tax=Pseudomonas sp. TH03 TaxID=2796369 RepID=UPI001F5B83FB|nr:AraC family transcriptional regulator [Pseudomonas sp. TH03]
MSDSKMSGSELDSPDTEPSLREDALQPTTIGSYTVAIARALDASGVDSKRIFTAIGIPLDVSTDPMTRLPAATMNKLYRACVDVTNNPYFGLTVAKHIHLTHLHALGYSLAASGTLLDFCRRLERYFRLVSQVAKASLNQADEQVLMRFDHLVGLSNETEDAFFGFLIRTMRLLYKQEFKPVRVELCRPMPHEGAGPYEALFRAPVLFGQASSLLVFDKAELAQPLSGSCPELAQVNDNIIISYLARLDKSDVITGVTQKIIEFLPDGDCSRDKVASALCMSPTKLQLKLSQRGTHFQQLLDDTRKELACSYLSQASRPVTEITFLLGFSDTSNFTRAFKRWTGLSPTDFRQQF